MLFKIFIFQASMFEGNADSNLHLSIIVSTIQIHFLKLTVRPCPKYDRFPTIHFHKREFQGGTSSKFLESHLKNSKVELNAEHRVINVRPGLSKNVAFTFSKHLGSNQPVPNYTSLWPVHGSKPKTHNNLLSVLKLIHSKFAQKNNLTA